LSTIKNIESKNNEYEHKIKELDEANINLEQKSNESCQNKVKTLTLDNNELRTQLEYQKSMNRILSSIIEQKFNIETNAATNISNFCTDHGSDYVFESNLENQDTANLSREVKHLKEMNHYLNNELRSLKKTDIQTN